jgi:transposase
MHDDGDLPDDIDALKALLVKARASISQMQQDMAERDLEIERLKAQIDKLKRMQFGRKSEKLGRQIEQLEARLEDLTSSRGAAETRNAQAGRKSASASKSTESERASREALPEHLPREEHVLEPELSCPECGGEMQALGEDVSEQLGRIAAAFKVIRTIRRKKVCACCHHIAQPPAPSLPVQRGIAHPSLLADIFVSKYADHQPLYRQSEIAARDKVTLDPANMGRWVGQCTALLDPLVEAVRRYAMASSKVHADDTPIPVLAPGNKKTKTGRLWVYVRDDHRAGSKEPAAVWFAYSPNRQGVHPQRHLAGFNGILQARCLRGLQRAVQRWLDSRGGMPCPREEKVLRHSRAHAVRHDAKSARLYRRALQHRSRHPRQAPGRTAARAAGKSQTAAQNLRGLAEGEAPDVVGKIRHDKGDQLLAQSVGRAHAVL